MAQHDYNLSNNTGALYRADNNAALQAIVTVNSGATAPTVTFPGMLWLDLSGGGDGVVRRRNQANSAWLTDIGQDQVARDAAAAAQTTANNAMPKTGGTFTGAINLIAAVPINNQAVSRTNADALYQVKLPTPVAGSLLYGTAAGWAAQLPPAANDTILALSGGLPTWTSTTTVGAPNSVVRTRSDGTIDPTLIPSVASGLRFRGTFKPEVNDEYPTTGGSGPVGAPAVGDFWVIDGLTTGGYTYLTGSLAGVTVYNGDSIAKSETDWYRMGSSVQLDGYMRVDGSTAMTGDLNMGDNLLVDVGGITARAGTPVPLNNFSIDATNVVISPQRGTTGPDLAVMAAGQIGTDIGRMQLFVGAGASNTGLLAVRNFSNNAAYSAGDHVVNTGRIYRALAAVTAGAFVASQWGAAIYDASGYATFTAVNPVIARSDAAPGLYFYNNGNPEDKTRAGISVESTSGDLIVYTSNDAGNLGHSGLRFRRDHSICPAYNGDTLGANDNGWWGAFLRSNLTFTDSAIDARVVCGVNNSLNTSRLSLLSTASYNGGGPYISLYANDHATTGAAGRIYISTYGQPIVVTCNNFIPSDNIGATSLGSATNPWGSFYLEGVMVTHDDIRMYTGTPEIIMLSPAGASASGKGYRVLSNVSDATDVGFYVSHWNGTTQAWDNLWTYSVGTNQTTIYSTFVVDGFCRPLTDNTRVLGQSNARWSTVYAATGTINTSDAREKTPLAALTVNEQEAARVLCGALSTYEMLNDPGVKHFGITAQYVNEVFAGQGLDPTEYALVTHDAWPETPEVIDPETGDVLQPGSPAGDRYGMRYDELNCMLIRSLDARLSALVQRVATLEGAPQ